MLVFILIPCLPAFGFFFARLARLIFFRAAYFRAIVAIFICHCAAADAACCLFLTPVLPPLLPLRWFRFASKLLLGGEVELNLRGQNGEVRSCGYLRCPSLYFFIDCFEEVRHTCAFASHTLRGEEAHRVHII